MVIQHICIDALENKTIDEKKEQCRENYNELKSGLLSYPMENCFKLFYRQMYKDFIFLGIKLACESGDMTFMLNGLFQGNRIGMIWNNCLNTTQDQSGGLVNIILAFAANDLKLVGKSMPVSPGISDNGYYKGHYNMMYAIYWKDQEAGREAEKQLLKFMEKKQSKFDLSFTLFAPQEYLSRAYHDAVKYDAVIETTSLKNNEAILTGEIPARRIGEYKSDLNFYTNGRSVCLTELKGYQETSGEPVVQPRRPNSRLDKVRHMFQKIM